MTPAVPDPTVEALVPESAHEWAKGHYIAFSDFSDPDPSRHVGFGTREATWRDAPTTWGEVADILVARAAAPDALRVRVEALAAEWESRPKPVTGWDSGLSATESGERLGQWNAFQRRAAELRDLLEDGAQ